MKEEGGHQEGRGGGENRHKNLEGSPCNIAPGARVRKREKTMAWERQGNGGWSKRRASWESTGGGGTWSCRSGAALGERDRKKRFVKGEQKAPLPVRRSYQAVQSQSNRGGRSVARSDLSQLLAQPKSRSKRPEAWGIVLGTLVRSGELEVEGVYPLGEGPPPPILLTTERKP